MHHPALRRADDGGQRHRLFLYLRRLGPAWANSLFEDGVAEVERKAELARVFPRWSNVTEGNAEFGLGMATATRQMRDRVERIMKEGLACDCCSAEIKALFQEWIDNRENTIKIMEVVLSILSISASAGYNIRQSV